MTNIQIDMDNDNNLNCNKELKELQENPMFKFSMSSLELFHSNFLEWLFDQNYSAFLKCFGIEVETNKEYTIEREFCLGSNKIDGKKKNWITDIAVFAKDKNNDDEKYRSELVLIIENKIKSLPSKGQLEAQAEFAGNNCTKVLLTLFVLPKDYDCKEFAVVGYEYLIKGIREQYKNTKYFVPYIEDYCQMVETLMQIINKDDVVKKNKKSYFTFHYDSDNLKDCGMQDAFRKYQAAQLVQMASNEFNDKSKYNYEMPIITAANLNNKKACVDVFLELEKDLYVGVQIEHDQFRVCFLGDCVKKMHKNADLNDVLKEFWKAWLVSPQGGVKKLGYCQYSEGRFVYRYVRIPGPKEGKNIKIDQLLKEGKWFEEHPDLSVKYILDKIIENKKEIIEKLYK